MSHVIHLVQLVNSENGGGNRKECVDELKNLSTFVHLNLLCPGFQVGFNPDGCHKPGCSTRSQHKPLPSGHHLGRLLQHFRYHIACGEGGWRCWKVQLVKLIQLCIPVNVMCEKY